MSTQRCIQPSHFIPLIKKEKLEDYLVRIYECASIKLVNCVVVSLAMEKLFLISCYSEGHSFLVKFKEFFLSLDESRCDCFIRDPEFTSNVSFNS